MPIKLLLKKVIDGWHYLKASLYPAKRNVTEEAAKIKIKFRI